MDSDVSGSASRFTVRTHMTYPRGFHFNLFTSFVFDRFLPNIFALPVCNLILSDDSPSNMGSTCCEFEDKPLPRAATTYLESVNESFESGRYSDFTVVCDGRQWKVHSFHLCHRSEVFERMIEGRFKARQCPPIETTGADESIGSQRTQD